MSTNWADFRSLLSNYDMSAVAALPDSVTLTREHETVLNVFQQFKVTLLMMALYLSHTTHLGSDLNESLLFGFLCHAVIHISPLVVLTLGSSLQVLHSVLDSSTFEILKPQLGMFFLVVSSLCEESGNLLISFFLCL